MFFIVYLRNFAQSDIRWVVPFVCLKTFIENAILIITWIVSLNESFISLWNSSLLLFNSRNLWTTWKWKSRSNFVNDESKVLIVIRTGNTISVDYSGLNLIARVNDRIKILSTCVDFLILNMLNLIIISFLLFTFVLRDLIWLEILLKCANSLFFHNLTY